MGIPVVTREYTPRACRNSRKPMRQPPRHEMRPDSPALHAEQLRFPNQKHKEPRWSPLGWTGWIFLHSKRLSSLLQHNSSKASIFWHSTVFTVQLSHPYMTTGKTIALTRQTFGGKVVSLILNVIQVDHRSKCLLILWLQSPSAVILEPKKVKSDTFHCFLIYFPWSDRTRCHDLSFLKDEL